MTTKNYNILRTRIQLRTIVTSVICLCATGGITSVATAAVTAEVSTHQVEPKRLVWVSDTSGEYVKNASNLFLPYSGQVSVADTVCVTMKSDSSHTASLLIDFGEELNGGVTIHSSIRGEQKPVKLHLCFGESVTEAMGCVGEQGATNDHAMRDFDIMAPWLGSVNVGDTGFRFLRIDLSDRNVEYKLKAVVAENRYRDLQQTGTFTSDNELLNKIWNVGAHTVHLCMQDYLWDGIKRDRLVWVGDMHPEVTTVNTVFGSDETVKRSLDFARDDTPLPGWMNGMCSYSLWWIIIHRDLYNYQRDEEYLRLQLPYLQGLVAQIDGLIDENGYEHLDGSRFLDWPTSECHDDITSGLHSLCTMAMEAVADIAGVLGDAKLEKTASNAVKRLLKVQYPVTVCKQTAALALLAGTCGDTAAATRSILDEGPQNFSTFYGYYMIEALAKVGKYEEAVDIIQQYWGKMIELGATTFWENLNWSDVANAAHIDEIVPEGKTDIHADCGAYCYKGLRMSLCHGWASGPTPWLTRHVLGIAPVPGKELKYAIEPHLVGCTRAEGSLPTPLGAITVSHRRLSNGKIESEVKAPQGVKIEARGTKMRLTRF